MLGETRLSSRSMARPLLIVSVSGTRPGAETLEMEEAKLEFCESNDDMRFAEVSMARKASKSLGRDFVRSKLPVLAGEDGSDSV